MENSKSVFEIPMKLAKELAYLEVLSKVKDMIYEIKNKKFFTYKVDDNFKDIYHIFFDNQFLISQKFPSTSSVDSYIKILEYGFSKGCAWSFEKIVDDIKDGVKVS